MIYFSLYLSNIRVELINILYRSDAAYHTLLLNYSTFSKPCKQEKKEKRKVLLMQPLYYQKKKKKKKQLNKIIEVNAAYSIARYCPSGFANILNTEFCTSQVCVKFKPASQQADVSS